MNGGLFSSKSQLGCSELVCNYVLLGWDSKHVEIQRKSCKYTDAKYLNNDYSSTLFEVFHVLNYVANSTVVIFLDIFLSAFLLFRLLDEENFPSFIVLLFLEKRTVTYRNSNCQKVPTASELGSYFISFIFPLCEISPDPFLNFSIFHFWFPSFTGKKKLRNFKPHFSSMWEIFSIRLHISPDGLLKRLRLIMFSMSPHMTGAHVWQQRCDYLDHLECVMDRVYTIRTTAVLCVCNMQYNTYLFSNYSFWKKLNIFMAFPFFNFSAFRYSIIIRFFLREIAKKIILVSGISQNAA